MLSVNEITKLLDFIASSYCFDKFLFWELFYKIINFYFNQKFVLLIYNKISTNLFIKLLTFLSILFQYTSSHRICSYKVSAIFLIIIYLNNKLFLNYFYF